MPVKQVIVIRKDLNMGNGKIATQAAHASIEAILGVDNQVLPTKDVKEWLDNGFTKICVYVNSEKELHDLYMKSLRALLPCSYIIDNRLGVPTAVGIGPGTIETVDLVTGDLPLL